VIALAPDAPHGGLARAHLQHGDVLRGLGRIAEASDAYRSAIAAAPADDATQIAARARASLRSIR
jgi:hypothetical protein